MHGASQKHIMRQSWDPCFQAAGQFSNLRVQLALQPRTGLAVHFNILWGSIGTLQVGE